uniref:THAP domain-containing protein 1 n=1 Tax=Fundulus heteroclitus TaxID=8078 RepID=A0A3Q2QJX4_FUNHE
MTKPCSRQSFHSFPVANAVRLLWLTKTRRDNFTPTKGTRVCSRHFLPVDVMETPGGLRSLKKGAIPVLFEWDNYLLPPPRLSVWQGRPPVDGPPADPGENPDSEMDVTVAPHHDDFQVEELQLRTIKSFLGCALWTIVLLENLHGFHFKVLIKNVLVHFSVLLPFRYLEFARAIC